MMIVMVKGRFLELLYKLGFRDLVYESLLDNIPESEWAIVYGELKKHSKDNIDQKLELIRNLVLNNLGLPESELSYNYSKIIRDKDGLLLVIIEAHRLGIKLHGVLNREDMITPRTEDEVWKVIRKKGLAKIETLKKQGKKVIYFGGNAHVSCLPLMPSQKHPEPWLFTFGPELFDDEVNLYLHLSIFIGTLEILSEHRDGFGKKGYNFFADKIQSLKPDTAELRVILSEDEHRLFIIYHTPSGTGAGLSNVTTTDTEKKGNGLGSIIKNIFGGIVSAFEVISNALATERTEGACATLPKPVVPAAPVGEERQANTTTDGQAQAENNKESASLTSKIYEGLIKILEVAREFIARVKAGEIRESAIFAARKMLGLIGQLIKSQAPPQTPLQQQGSAQGSGIEEERGEEEQNVKDGSEGVGGGNEESYHRILGGRYETPQAGADRRNSGKPLDSGRAKPDGVKPEEPRDASAKGDSRDEINRLVQQYGGILGIIGKYGELTPSEFAQLYSIGKDVMAQLLAKGVHFGRGPPDIGVANYVENGIIYILIPENGLPKDVLHEIKAVLNPKLTHKEIEESLTQPQGRRATVAGGEAVTNGNVCVAVGRSQTRPQRLLQKVKQLLTLPFHSPFGQTKNPKVTITSDTTPNNRLIQKANLRKNSLAKIAATTIFAISISVFAHNFLLFSVKRHE